MRRYDTNRKEICCSHLSLSLCEWRKVVGPSSKPHFVHSILIYNNQSEKKELPLRIARILFHCCSSFFLYIA